MTSAAITAFEAILAIMLAPLLIGWIDVCRAWLQNRRGAGVLQPYRTIRKLLHKDAVIAHDASPLFRLSPYVQFGAMAMAAAIIPVFSVSGPLSIAADTIALVGVFALARVFMALAAMDIGTAFGTLGARREMLIGFLAEPALLMVFLTASLISQSTLLPTIVEVLGQIHLTIFPSLAFAAVAFVMVLLAENARIPIDNPATHLELTMIHEAMVLEYSARHLALIEWASALKLFNYAAIGIALFVPWGLAGREAGVLELALALPIAGLKLALAGAALATVETLSAKLRIFRAPEFLATAFLLAVLGLLVRLLLGS
ncbi:MAG: NADH-quinone oxidoreductase subunit H [Rhodanobacteraceae bacterium]